MHFTPPQIPPMALHYPAHRVPPQLNTKGPLNRAQRTRCSLSQAVTCSPPSPLQLLDSFLGPYESSAASLGAGYIPASSGKTQSKVLISSSQEGITTSTPQPLPASHHLGLKLEDQQSRCRMLLLLHALSPTQNFVNLSLFLPGSVSLRAVSSDPGTTPCFFFQVGE